MASNLYFSSKNISRNKLYYRPRVCKESEGNEGNEGNEGR